MTATLACYIAAVINFLFAMAEGFIAHRYDRATFMCCSAIFLLQLGKAKV
jgi:hypothetical protein